MNNTNETTHYQYRYNLVRVHETLFDKETRVKFRGTHLLDNEEAFDHDDENNSSFPQLAWSYGRESSRAEQNSREFEQKLGSTRGGLLDPNAVYTKDMMDEMMLAARK
jgi:hypothetical protein